MYTDSGGADENGVVTNVDRKLATKERHLLRGTIDDVGGIHSKLWRYIEKRGTESSDTSDNIKAKILKCP